MQPLSPDDIETVVKSEGTEYLVRVFPEGPIGFEEQTSNVSNNVVISHRAWPAIVSHAETAERGEVLERTEAGIQTTVTADGNGGVEIIQAYGDDIITFSAAAVPEVDEHIRLTRFKLQGRGFDAEAGL